MTRGFSINPYGRQNVCPRRGSSICPITKRNMKHAPCTTRMFVLLLMVVCNVCVLFGSMSHPIENLKAPSPFWIPEGVLVSAGLRPCHAGVLQLRGGREKEEARFDAENENLAQEYMASLRRKGMSLDLNDPNQDDVDAPFGVPEQVRDEEAESKRKSKVTQSPYDRWRSKRRNGCI